MATDQQPWELLGSYLNGNISSKDKSFVEGWIGRSQENQKLFSELKHIWQSADVRLQYKDIDSIQSLQELRLRINAQQRPLGKVISMVRPHKQYWRVAAAICLLMVSYFVIRWATRENVIIETGDQIATVYLPDSTKVWLNLNSRMIYPRKFKTRNVELQGEAFLSVRKDTTDFTVTTKRTVTNVLGTALNVKEQLDSSVTLTVAEGTVKFSSRDSAKEESITVKAREKAVFMPETKLKKTQNNDPSFAMWREQNNPAFEEEKNSPELFLNNSYTWRKNQINQSVIEGTLKNNASLAAYYKIALEITYTKPDGNVVTVDLTITDTVYPGKQLPYKRRLLDILSDTKSVVVKIKSAEVTSKNSY